MLKKFLVVMAFVDKAENKAVPRHVVLEATSLRAAWDVAAQSVGDKEWLRAHIAGEMPAPTRIWSASPSSTRASTTSRSCRFATS